LHVTFNRHRYSSLLIVTCACAAVLALAGPPHAGAAEPGAYPTRAVRLVVPFAPGGADIVGAHDGA
jgi:tripartite-type tricarboxylate transporter receptor subunit TctC